MDTTQELGELINAGPREAAQKTVGGETLAVLVQLAIAEVQRRMSGGQKGDRTIDEVLEEAATEWANTRKAASDLLREGHEQ